MTASRHGPARSSVLLGVAVVTLTVSAGVGAGLLAQMIAPDTPEGDAEAQGLIVPPDDDPSPQGANNSGPLGVAPPSDDPPPSVGSSNAPSVRPPRTVPVVRRTPQQRIRTRTS